MKDKSVVHIKTHILINEAILFHNDSRGIHTIIKTKYVDTVGC